MDTYSYASTPLLEGPPTQALWAVSGDDPEKVSAHQVAQRMNIRMTQPHLVWNPHDGGLAIMIEADRENRYKFAARQMFVVLVVAQDHPAFTDYPEQHLQELLTHLPESIPDDWPLGPPSAVGLMPVGQKTKPGHYSLDQISAYGIPTGAIDIRRMASK